MSSHRCGSMQLPQCPRSLRSEQTWGLAPLTLRKKLRRTLVQCTQQPALSDRIPNKSSVKVGKPLILNSGAQSAPPPSATVSRQFGQQTIFNLQQLLLSNIWVKMLVYFMVGVPLVPLGALLLQATGDSFVEGLTKTYASLYKVPNVDVLATEELSEKLVLNVLWFMGTFSFGVIIGLLSEEINEQVKMLRDGNYPLPLAGHTIVLGWNIGVVPVLKQIAIAHKERQGECISNTVVILAPVPKAQLDKELELSLQGYASYLKLYCRTGTATALGDVQRVGAAQAQTVLLIKPPTRSEDNDEALSAILTLAACRQAAAKNGLPLSQQRMVVSVPDSVTDNLYELSRWEAACAVARSPGSMTQVTLLDGIKGVARLMAQSVVQPGVASLVSQLLQHSFSGSELYLQRNPLRRSVKYGTLRRMFPTAVLVGFASGSIAGLMDMTPAMPETESTPDGGNGSTPPANEALLPPQPAYNGTVIAPNGFTAAAADVPLPNNNAPSSILTNRSEVLSDGDAALLAAFEAASAPSVPLTYRQRILHINPEDNQVVGPQDALLALAPDARSLHILPAQGQAPKACSAYVDALRALVRMQEQRETLAPASEVPTRIVIMSMDGALVSAQVLDQVLQYAAPGSHVQLVSADPRLAGVLQSRKARLMRRGITAVHVEGRPTEVAVLLKLPLAAATRCLLLPSGEVDSRQHDAQLQSMCLAVQSALLLGSHLQERGALTSIDVDAADLADAPEQLHLVVVTRHNETLSALESALQLLPSGRVCVECVSPPRLLAGWLVHTALGPDIGQLLRTMVDEGDMLSLLPASCVIPAPLLQRGPLMVPLIVEASRAIGTTAIGVVTAAGDVRLLPSCPEQRIQIQEHDFFVVLAASRVIPVR